jgi:hypothetical protein
LVLAGVLIVVGLLASPDWVAAGCIGTCCGLVIEAAYLFVHGYPLCEKPD